MATLTGLLCLAQVHAAPSIKLSESPGTPHIVFLAGSENLSFNLLFRQRLEKALPSNIKLMNYSARSQAQAPRALVITLGPSAVNDIVQQDKPVPTLALMVTESQFAQYRALGRPDLSAVYLNPPLARQALLGQQILPQASRIAVLAEPGQEQRYSTLAEELAPYGLDLRTFTVESPENLVSTLSRALNYGDFLLGTPNPEIYNRQTIKHILLTTYRHNRILIGPERAFVQAGALASTYTPTEAVVQQTVDIIQRYVASGQLPAPDFPDQYSVLFNEQVARSLNIPLPETTEVLDRLRALEDTNTGVGNE